jgi:hypothetical protein
MTITVINSTTKKAASVYVNDNGEMLVAGGVGGGSGLTDAQLRASAVPVSLASTPGVTDSQLRAAPVPVLTQPGSASGTITTQNLNSGGVATAGSAVEVDMLNAGQMGIQTVGTFTGALSIQYTLNGTDWQTMAGSHILNTTTNGQANTIGSGNQGVFIVPAAGMLKARVTALAAVTGSVVVTLKAVTGVTLIPFISSIASCTPVTPTTTFTNSAASTNATSNKASAATLWSALVSNSNAAVRYFKLYNKASAPTVGTDIPVIVMPVPPGTVAQIDGGANGIRFTTGVAWALTTGIADTDTGAVSASEHKVALSVS